MSLSPIPDPNCQAEQRGTSAKSPAMMAAAKSLFDVVDCASPVPLGDQLTAAFNDPQFQQQATSAGWELESGPLNAGPGTVRVYVAMRDPAGGPTACSVIVTDVPSKSYGCTDL